jgi:hypothetical protein
MRLYGPHVRSVENSAYDCDISYFMFKLQQFSYEYAETCRNIKYLILKVHIQEHSKYNLMFLWLPLRKFTVKLMVSLVLSSEDILRQNNTHWDIMTPELPERILSAWFLIVTYFLLIN